MRYEIAIALILCGTLLVLAPPVSDHLAARQASEVMKSRPDLMSAEFVSSGLRPMSYTYRAGCMALGAAMIGTGVLGSFCCKGASAHGETFDTV